MLGVQKKDVLYADHVRKDCLGMILFGKIGDMKKSSLTFIIQYFVEVGTLGNETDKEEEYLVGVARVNKIDLVKKVL